MQSLPSPWSWNFDPLLFIVGALFLAGYFVAITRLGPRYSDEKVSRRRIVYFLIGVITFWLALLPRSTRLVATTCSPLTRCSCWF